MARRPRSPATGTKPGRGAMRGVLHHQRSGAQQVGEPRALLGVEHRVQRGQRIGDALLQALRALDPQLRRLLRLAGVERVAAGGIGEQRERTPVVHRGLRTLGLQLVDDGGEPLELRLREPELPGQESQRPADAEPAGEFVAGGVVVMGLLRVTGVFAAAVAAGSLIHGSSPLAGAGSLPGGGSRGRPLEGRRVDAGTMPRAELEISTSVRAIRTPSLPKPAGAEYPPGMVLTPPVAEIERRIKWPALP